MKILKPGKVEQRKFVCQNRQRRDFYGGNVRQKRVNPRRKPATMSDVKRAKQEAQDRALRAAWSIFFTVLRDKEGYTLEDLQRCWKEVEDLSDSIAKGYCTIEDLREILRVEEGVNLT